MKPLIVLFLSVVLFASCSKDSFDDDVESIKKYLAEKNLTASGEDRGVYYIINEAGEEEKPSVTSEVTVFYTGYYLDGTRFDGTQSGGSPARFGLNQVIEGWQIGIRKFGKGGKGTILIPSKLGYGSNPPFGVRANAVLVFDIELVDFK